MNKNEDYEILGYKVRFKPEVGDHIDPQGCVDLVNKLVKEINQNAPELDKAQTAILVALRLASEKIDLEVDFKESIQQLHSAANDAFRIIEKVAPTPIN